MADKQSGTDRSAVVAVGQVVGRSGHSPANAWRSPKLPVTCHSRADCDERQLSAIANAESRLNTVPAPTENRVC